MSKTLHQFGAVLFDELEQVAVRRGGFASLKYLVDEVSRISDRVNDANNNLKAAIAAGPYEAGEAVQEADSATREAAEILEKARRAAQAVQELAAVTKARVRAAEGATKLARDSSEASRPDALLFLSGRIAAFIEKLRKPRRGEPGAERTQWSGNRGRSKTLRDTCNEFMNSLDVAGPSGKIAGAQDAVRRAEAVNVTERRKASSKAGDAARGAAAKRGGEVSASLAEAAEAVASLREIYGKIRVTRHNAEEALRLVRESQSDDILFTIDDVVADTARRAALGMDTVGLAFSGGGIRSATFNLGFLQGLATFGLLKNFDYLSTVSGGGYIGAWLASWVRREGGPAGDPEPPDRDISEAAARIDALGKTKLKEYENRVKKEKQRGLGLQRMRVLVARRGVAAERLKLKAERLKKAADRLKRKVEGRLRVEHGKRVEMKRRRTSDALKNVERQLNPSRYVQGRADRRWVTAEEIRLGREQASDDSSIALKGVVEEEPEPVYHLRAYSNYLAPKLGLTSVDTWTMFSIYLRNLLLNQFILLPMILAAVFVPRFFLWVFHLTPNRHGSHLAWEAWRWVNLVVIAGSSALAFYTVYWVIAVIRKSREPDRGGAGTEHREVPMRVLWIEILAPLVLLAVGVSAIFSHPGRPFFDVPLPPLSGRLPHVVQGVFDLKFWADHYSFMPALYFGALVGVLRFLMSWLIENNDHPSDGGDVFVRTVSALVSGFVSGAGLAAALSWLGSSFGPSTYSLLAPAMLTFGPPLVILAIAAGAAIEVGLISGYREEDMREWRGSLAAYLLLIGVFWMVTVGLSLYGPLLVWATRGWFATAAGAGWLFTSVSGALAGGSSKTDGSGPGNVREYVAQAAPPVFVVGLLVLVSALASVLQGAEIPLQHGDPLGALNYFAALNACPAWKTAGLLAVCVLLGFIGCWRVNVNLFSLNTFYANRLVRCYLGASRPRAAPVEGRPNFAPTNSPVPVRRPNPVTGFDPTDDFPMRDLTVVRSWEEDLVCDYQGPYHLVNTAMNLVAGSELAWQERMAESFILSPLHCGSKTTGYRKANIVKSDLEQSEYLPDEENKTPRDEVVGYGGDVRLGTAVSVSGAAASPNAGYHSSPLVTILMTVFNARLGLWFGNPARRSWRNSGPGFAYYLFDELFGRTTNKGRYVYLSDGGHFENLGVYELVRRRCRYVVLCDAGADPGLSFWDLGSLVRKCRTDFGIRIELDISPILKREGLAHSKWHCAVGRIHYEDVDEGAIPGTLFYVKPVLTGDEPSDVRNYVVDHPTFPHESTADQFFSESQFESYRVLGEHTAVTVFGQVVREAGPSARPTSLFSKLRRRWFPPPPDLDRNFKDSVKPFVDIQDALRTDPNLRRLSQQLYPELDDETVWLNEAQGHETSDRRRSEVHAVLQMLQAMENTWLAIDLESHSDHPLNRGWMNVFRRWTSSGVFQTHWSALRGEFSEGFVRFCENELNLNVHDPKVAWVGKSVSGWKTVDEATLRAAVDDLNREFVLEWPRVVFPEISDEPSGLPEVLEHALANRTKAGTDWSAWIIVPGNDSHNGDGRAAEPRCYGVIIAWETSDGVTDVVVWLRGAYRTLGIGRKAVKPVLDELKARLETVRREGYTLRARYPGANRIRTEHRWQSRLWLDFFQNQGFLSRVVAGTGDETDNLEYRYDPL